MTTILTAHQPLYIPWLGFFQKISMSDVFCVLDDVQFTPNDYIHRNRIKGPNGPVWLTIPVKTKGHLDKTINDITIDNSQTWKRKHWISLVVAYGKKAPYFESYSDFFKDTYKREWERVVDIDIHILQYLLKELGISVTFLRSSEQHFEGKKSERVLDMCQKLGADMYIFGEMGKNYADTAKFSKHSISIYFQKYKHPIYPQLYGNFVSHLSVLDLLFCFGEKSYDIITMNNPQKVDLMKKFGL